MLELGPLIRDVPDFPKKGILFKDITTLLKNPSAFKQSIDQLTGLVRALEPQIVIGMESRGFIFAAPIAYLLDAGFVPVRKLGKLPGEVISSEYELEYGTNTLELHSDAIKKGDRVLIVDDLLATGGTVSATIELVERLEGKVVGVAFLVELMALKGRDRLQDFEVISLLKF
jgi:adenine phosphoribosyltransferase